MSQLPLKIQQILTENIVSVSHRAVLRIVVPEAEYRDGYKVGHANVFETEKLHISDIEGIEGIHKRHGHRVTLGTFKGKFPRFFYVGGLKEGQTFRHDIYHVRLNNKEQVTVNYDNFIETFLTALPLWNMASSDTLFMCHLLRQIPTETLVQYLAGIAKQTEIFADKIRWIGR